MEYSTYNYTINMIWINGSEQIVVAPDRIKSLIIDYDYRLKNMPIMFISINVSRTFADKIILGKSTAKMYLSMDKYMNQGIVNKQKYIRGEFIYFMNNDINYNNSIDYAEETNIDSKDEDKFRKLTIGLFNIEFINKNKYTVNSIYQNATNSDIILLNTRHCNVLMEPIQNDILHKQLLVPPLTSVSRLIKYLDSIHSLYTTPHIFFMDLDGITYIMSSSGKVLKTFKDDISNITIRINDPIENSSKVQGMMKDTDNSTYIIDVSAVDTNMTINTVQDKIYNRIIGIDSYGNTVTKELEINSDPSIKINDNFVMISNGNMSEIDMRKKTIERSEITLRVTKDDIDSSLFTPNKRYSIRNYTRYKHLNGDFTLDNKKEVFSTTGIDFIVKVMCTFRKI